MNIIKPAILVLLTIVTTAHVYAEQITVQVVNQNDTPVENAVAYAEPTTKQAWPAAEAAAIEQKNKTFLPLVTVIQTGATITFPNRDSVRHHVYSFSPAKTFELKLYSGLPSTPVLFDKPGTVTLGCNIHDQMLAYVQVVDTPYFAKTDPAGVAKINLPSGSYLLKVWHYSLAKENVPAEQALAVKGNEQVKAKLELKKPEPK